MCKNFEEDKPINLKPQQIVTFNANRFGQDIVITHYFNKTEINSDGELLIIFLINRLIKFHLEDNVQSK